MNDEISVMRQALRTAASYKRAEYTPSLDTRSGNRVYRFSGALLSALLMMQVAQADEEAFIDDLQGCGLSRAMGLIDNVFSASGNSVASAASLLPTIKDISATEAEVAYLAQNDSGGQPVNSSGCSIITYAPANIYAQRVNDGAYPELDIYIHLDCPYLGGILTGLLLHELIHSCVGNNGNSLTTACEAEYRSCDHLATDFAVHTALCAYVTEQLGMHCMFNHKTQEWSCRDGDLLVEMGGLCAEIRRLEKKWNNTIGKGVVMDCRAGNTPCPYRGCTNVPPDSVCRCPTGDPQDPTDPYPKVPSGLNVLQPCEECNGV